MSEELCPRCGGVMAQTDKDTSSGTDWREFTCRSCGRNLSENRGKALWEILSDDREDKEAARALSVGDAVVLSAADPGLGLQAGARGRVVSVDIIQGRIEVDFAQPRMKTRIQARFVERTAQSGDGWLEGLRRLLRLVSRDK